MIGIVVFGAGVALGVHWFLPKNSETEEDEITMDDPEDLEGDLEDSSQIPTIYITIASHEQGPESTRSTDYVNDEEAFWTQREGIVNFANMIYEEGAKYNFQSEFNFLQALVKYDKGTESTKGKNLLRYLMEDLGFEVDTSFHSEDCNQADGAYLFEQLGVPPSHTVGGLIASPAEDSKIEYYRNELHGLQYDATWKAEILWGAAILYHKGNEEELWASGIWRPQDNENFLVNDENAPLPYVGLYMHGWEGLDELMAKQQAGELEPGKIYTITIFATQDSLKNPETTERFRSKLLALSEYRERGELQFVGIKEVVDIWETQFNSEPNIYRYTEAQVEDTTSETSPDSTEAGSIKIVFASNLEEGESCHRDGATGCDLYLAEYDIENHDVKSVERLTFETEGPEWFSDIDSQGEFIVYEAITQDSMERNINTIDWMNLESGAKGVLVESARFPDISADDAYLVYGNSVLNNVMMADLVQEEEEWGIANSKMITDAKISEDPSLSPDNKSVIYHFRTTSGSAQTKVLDRATGEMFDFTEAIGCGHATFNLDGSTAVCVMPKGTAIHARDYANGEWGELYDLTPAYTVDDFVEVDARYEGCKDVVLSYPAFCGSNDYLLMGAQCLTAPDSEGRSETTFSELFLLEFGSTAKGVELIPLHTQIEEFLGVEGKDSVTAACR